LLSHSADAVVVWIPDEPHVVGALTMPLIDRVVRSRYRPEAKFGKIEVWRRIPEGPGP
jgi:hypothetical protein